MQSLKKTNLWFQVWHEGFGEFSPNHSEVWMFHFDGLFLSKVYQVWAKKLQRSYLSWHWTVMQILNKPSNLLVTKMAWGIGWTYIKALKSLKNCTLIGSFCPKYIMFQLENFRRIMGHDTERWSKENWHLAWKIT